MVTFACHMALLRVTWSLLRVTWSLCNAHHREGTFIREISYLPLALDIPIAFNSCRKGPRALEWRDDQPASLCWIEAQVPLLLPRQQS
jgi:hypothetical protein